MGLGYAHAAVTEASQVRSYVFGQESRLAYQVTHPLHTSVGVSRQLRGEVTVLEGTEGRLEVPLTLQVPVRSFRSGNRSRDRNMALVLDAEHHPWVRLTLDRIDWTSRKPGVAGLELSGEGFGKLNLKGVSRPVSVALSGVLGTEILVVSGHLTFSLEAHGVERPSLMLRPIDDAVVLDIAATASVRTPERRSAS